MKNKSLTCFIAGSFLLRHALSPPVSAVWSFGEQREHRVRKDWRGVYREGFEMMNFRFDLSAEPDADGAAEDQNLKKVNNQIQILLKA